MSPNAPDLLSDEAQSALESWSEVDRVLFDGLLADASSELQQELLQRAVAAGHPASAVHGFADAIRPLSDRELYEACTPPALHQGQPLPVDQRLRAEADPLFAFSLSRTPGVSLGDEADVPTDYGPPGEQGRIAAATAPARGAVPVPGEFEATTVDLGGKRRGRVKVLFDEGEGAGALSSPASAPSPHEALLQRARRARPPYVEDLLNAVGRALGFSYRELEVDDVDLTLEGAVALVGEALARGWPVPVLLGSARGRSEGGALLLQSQPIEGSRRFQLHEPSGRETIWVDVRLLAAGSALPLKNPRLRRLTRICVPSGPRTPSDRAT